MVVLCYALLVFLQRELWNKLDLHDISVTMNALNNIGYYQDEAV